MNYEQEQLLSCVKDLSNAFDIWENNNESSEIFTAMLMEAFWLLLPVACDAGMFLDPIGMTFYKIVDEEAKEMASPQRQVIRVLARHVNNATPDQVLRYHSWAVAVQNRVEDRFERFQR